MEIVELEIPHVGTSLALSVPLEVNGDCPDAYIYVARVRL